MTTVTFVLMVLVATNGLGKLVELTYFMVYYSYALLDTLDRQLTFSFYVSMCIQTKIFIRDDFLVSELKRKRLSRFR